MVEKLVIAQVRMDKVSSVQQQKLLNMDGVVMRLFLQIPE